MKPSCFLTIVCCYMLLQGCSSAVRETRQKAKVLVGDILREDGGYIETELRFETDESDVGVREFSTFCDRSLARRTETIAKIRSIVGLDNPEREQLTAFLAIENSVIRAKEKVLVSLISLESLRDSYADSKKKLAILNALMSQSERDGSKAGLETALEYAYQARDVAGRNATLGAKVNTEAAATNKAIRSYHDAFYEATKAEHALSSMALLAGTKPTTILQRYQPEYESSLAKLESAMAVKR